MVNTQDLSIANIRIQPNPTRDFLQLLDLQNLPKDCTLSLYNTVGQQVYTQNLQSGINQLTIDMASFPVGVYYLKIKNPDQEFQGKRVIKIE